MATVNGTTIKLNPCMNLLSSVAWNCRSLTVQGTGHFVSAEFWCHPLGRLWTPRKRCENMKCEINIYWHRAGSLTKVFLVLIKHDHGHTPQWMIWLLPLLLWPNSSASPTCWSTRTCHPYPSTVSSMLSCTGIQWVHLPIYLYLMALWHLPKVAAGWAEWLHLHLRLRGHSKFVPVPLFCIAWNRQWGGVSRGRLSHVSPLPPLHSLSLFSPSAPCYCTMGTGTNSPVSKSPILWP